MGAQGVGYRDGEESWWHMQLEGTVDVACAPSMDWFHGGLQYQAVHHLFPRLPRQALRNTSGRVAEAAAACGLEYKAVPFTEANRMVLATLAKTAAAARRAPTPAEVPRAPLIWDGLYARG